MVLTQKETHALVRDFYKFAKEKSMVGKPVDRSILKSGIYTEFKEMRVLNNLKITSLGTVLHFLKRDGYAKSEGRMTITLISSSENPTPKPDVVADAMAVEKRRRRNRKDKAKEVFKQLSNYVEHGSEETKSLEVIAVHPSFICNEKGSIQFIHSVENKESTMRIQIKNKSSNNILIYNCRVLSKHAEFDITNIFPEGKKKRRIRPGRETTIKIMCKSYLENVGALTTELLLQYCSTESPKGKMLTRVYFIRFEKSNDLVKKLMPKNPYVKPVTTVRKQYTEIVPGVRPPSLSTDKLERKLKLAEFNIPTNVKNALNEGAFVRDAQPSGYKAMRELIEASLDKSNYAEKFHLLLYLEELQNIVDIRRYDMSSVRMTKEGKMLFLEVPGLAEKRPSVLRGDRIFVAVKDANGSEIKKEYEGYVHHVERDRIALGFNQSLLSKHTNKTKYSVRFTFNRLPMKLAHRAVGMRFSDQMIFPRKCNALYSDIKIRKDELKNVKILLNPEQTMAVNNIVRGKSTSVPYIVFGPPGTGKTVTIVESIHQIIRFYEGCHVLVCAPSNSACDHLTKLLLENVRHDAIFRMHAASRAWKDVPHEIRHVSNYKDREFYFPPKRDLSNYEIIVCTLITAGRLVSAKFPDDHFTHIFVDEAGQATEPECMVALAGNLAQGGQVVLAGDPKQLGPVIMSAAAREYGLGISYLERLMETELLYQKDPETQSYNQQHITKLLNNYRSHKSIIKVPNDCFYDSELRYLATEVQSFCKWTCLPQLGFPVIFEGICGEDLRESSSPSFYNPHEISVLVDYVRKVMDFKIAARNIGVIAPYRKQVEKIKRELSDPNIKVGSVEEFQGQEREVIIISTVRSDSKHLSFDAKHNLGFLTDAKRFNVAITRAKSLLIIIGNPHILGLNFYWKTLLEYCIEKNAYRGVQFTKDKKRSIDVDEIDNLLNEMEDLELEDDFSDSD
ncbi:putative helicase MOV-10 [Styela clava]